MTKGMLRLTWLKGEASGYTDVFSLEDFRICSQSRCCAEALDRAHGMCEHCHRMAHFGQGLA